MSTRRGIAVTDPQHQLTNRVAPGVVITQVHVDGIELPAEMSADIKPGHRQYSFEYAGVSLNNPAGVQTGIHHRHSLSQPQPESSFRSVSQLSQEMRADVQPGTLSVHLQEVTACARMYSIER